MRVYEALLKLTGFDSGLRLLLFAELVCYPQLGTETEGNRCIHKPTFTD